MGVEALNCVMQHPASHLLSAEANRLAWHLADTCGTETCLPLHVDQGKVVHAAIKLKIPQAKARDAYVELQGVGILTPHLEAAPKSTVESGTSKRLRADRVALIARDGGRCNKCHIDGNDMPEGEVLHVDHIQPVARGGTEALTNKQLLCRSCNSKKGVRR